MAPSIRAVAGALAFVVLAALPGTAGPDDRRRARLGVRYLVTQQAEDGSITAFSTVGSTADAVMGFVAARRAPRAIDEAVEFLRARGPEVPLGQKAKIVMALVAAGEDPRDVEGRDLIAEIEATQTAEGQYATTPGDFAGEVTSHILAMLALEAAGAVPDPQADRWLIAAQCADGGWQFDEPATDADDEHCFTGSAEDFARSDSNTTSYAVQALIATEPAIDPAVDPFTFFPRARDPIKRGWIYDPASRCNAETRPPDCFLTDANSTALVIQAYVAADKPIPRGGGRALAALKYAAPCGRLAGAFAFTWEERGGELRRSPARDEARGPSVVGATIAAIPGLLRKPFPIAHAPVTKPPPFAECR
ncbi:MAG: terpene cyclase/mutase family protein [Actinomycetota bacterium]|nr:terpene cyclase/mutase family protein [Actinomycetota bacterium]